MKKVDMLHAADYANMPMAQVSRTVQAAKLQDEFMQKAIKYVLVFVERQTKLNLSHIKIC